MNSCAFTGHRSDSFLFQYDEKHPLCRKIKKAIFDECRRLYISENVKTFYTGCALGTDIWGAEAVLQLRGSFPDIKLICAVPYPNHTFKWLPEQKKRLHKIMLAADDYITVSGQYSNNVYKLRNYYIVDKSQYLLAVFDGEKNIKSGTKQTVNYARKKQLNVILIHPDTANITIE